MRVKPNHLLFEACSIPSDIEWPTNENIDHTKSKWWIKNNRNKVATYPDCNTCGFSHVWVMRPLLALLFFDHQCFHPPHIQDKLFLINPFVEMMIMMNVVPWSADCSLLSKWQELLTWQATCLASWWGTRAQPFSCQLCPSLKDNGFLKVITVFWKLEGILKVIWKLLYILYLKVFWKLGILKVIWKFSES